MRSITYPTMQELESAFLQADGDFATADGSKLAEYQLAFLVKNSKLRGHVKTRRTAVSSWDWDILPFEPSGAELAKSAKRRLSKVISQIIPGRVNTDLFGHYVADVEFQLEDENRERKPIIRNKIRPTDIIAVGYEQARVRIAGKESTRTIKSLVKGEKGEVNPLITLIESDGEDFRGGQLLSIAVSEILRLDMMAEWANWSKKQKGMIQAIDKGASEEMISTAVDSLRGLLKNNYVVTDEFIEYVFHQMANSSAGQSFKDFNQTLDNAISIAILGQANTAELPKNGARAAVEVQRKISMDIMYADALATEELINTQLLPYDIHFNINSQEAPYEFKIMLAEQEDYEGNSIILREAIASGLAIKKSEAYERIGFTPPEEGDEVIEGLPS